MKEEENEQGNQELQENEIRQEQDTNQVQEQDEVYPKDNRNLKEVLYDKIRIPLRALDIIIAVLITILVIMLLYFVIRKFA
jgi:hypothetical protein